LGKRLRERWPALKVVLMSGYIEEALRANASEQGWHFLQKPFELTDLARHLRAALDGKTTHDGSLLPQAPLGPVSDLVTIRPPIA
jgi:DNA-binding NtrC family response regulator